MLCPFPIITDPFMGTKLYTPNLLLVICLVAGFDSAISFVTRAFPFSPFFLEYRDAIMVFSISVGRLAFLPSPHPY